MNIGKIRNKLQDYNQEHVLKWWNQLDDTQRKWLLQDIESIDFELMEKLVNQYMERKEISISFDDIKSPEIIKIPRTEREILHQREAREIGEQCIRDGKAACFVVAGGQGTRLGFEGPKGAYPIGPISANSIFQFHAEKILKAQQKYNVQLMWYIMTSKLLHEQTIEFFEDNKYFGMHKDQVRFFSQRMLPAIDKDGRFLMSSKYEVFKSPNGHGGALLALRESGAIDEMLETGIEYISYFQIDNLIVNVLDPVFIGYHVKADAQMSNKVTPKIAPSEKVGAVVVMDKKYAVIEYSDLPQVHMSDKDKDGSFKFNAGSIAIHILNTEFVKSLTEKGIGLPYHIAEKNIPYVNNSGEYIKPKDKNGIKFETFIFDALKFAENVANMEVMREDEFSPIKNLRGSDSVESGKQLYINRCARWLMEAGIDIPFDKNGISKIKIEISPLFANSPDDLQRKDLASIDTTRDIYLA
ncbi:UDPGP type 1 family protein [bacterium]|nr:UDPGP type 1 family protein [bacterium]